MAKMRRISIAVLASLALVLLVPVLVMAAGQLAGGLAWLRAEA